MPEKRSTPPDDYRTNDRKHASWNVILMTDNLYSRLFQQNHTKLGVTIVTWVQIWLQLGYKMPNLMSPIL